MESLHKYLDLEQHFLNSLTVLDQQHEIEKEKQNLSMTLDKLTQEMESLKKSEQDLILQLRTHLDMARKKDGVNLLYANLKEKHSKLQNTYNSLEKENSTLKEKFIWEKNELTEDFAQEIKLSHEKISEQYNNFLKKETELNVELEAQQASADFRYDDMESTLQTQIREITKKFQNSAQSCNTLREEFLTYKRQSNLTIENANKHIQELQKQLQLSQQQLQLTQEKLFDTTRNRNSAVYLHNENASRETNQVKANTSGTKPSINTIKNRIVMYDNTQNSANKPNYVCTTTKYHPLIAMEEANQEMASSEQFSEMLHDVTPKQLPKKVSCSATPTRCGTQSSNKFLLPPLKQVSTPAPKPRLNIKKRKLYNPDNLDYMNDMEQPE